MRVIEGNTGRSILIMLLCIFVITVIPIFMVTYLPMNDLPFDIAWFHVLLHWEESPFLQDRYMINSFMMPNVGSDLIVLAIAKVLPLFLAVRLFIAFIAMTVVITVSGVVFLHYCMFSRWSVWPLVSSLIVYNLIFVFGFIKRVSARQ